MKHEYWRLCKERDGHTALRSTLYRKSERQSDNRTYRLPFDYNPRFNLVLTRPEVFPLGVPERVDHTRVKVNRYMPPVCQSPSKTIPEGKRARTCSMRPTEAGALSIALREQERWVRGRAHDRIHALAGRARAVLQLDDVDVVPV